MPETESPVNTGRGGAKAKDGKTSRGRRRPRRRGAKKTRASGIGLHRSDKDTEHGLRIRPFILPAAGSRIPHNSQANPENTVTKRDALKQHNSLFNMILHIPLYNIRYIMRRYFEGRRRAVSGMKIVRKNSAGTGSRSHRQSSVGVIRADLNRRARQPPTVPSFFPSCFRLARTDRIPACNRKP